MVYMKHPDLKTVVEVPDSAEAPMARSGWQRLNKTESASYEKSLREDMTAQERAMQESTPGVDTEEKK